MICQDDNCDFNPDFAVICSFIAQFGDKIDLDLNIDQLKASIEDSNQLDEQLIDLHVKLLKKLRRYFVRDQWEKALIRFASEYSYEDADQIQQLGYQHTRPSIKLNLLRRLLDAQFECDPKFKAAVNLINEANELRQLPIGRDIKGNTYWQRSDNEGNFRLFQEQPLDYRSWRTVCKTTDELNNLIDELEKEKDERVKGEPMPEPYDPLPLIFPEYFIKKEQVVAIKEEVAKNKIDDELETKTTICKGGGKRGRGKGRNGRTRQTQLPILNEEQENNCNGNKLFDSPNGCQKSTTFVDDKKVNIVKTNDTSSICTTQSTEQFTNLDESSTESQVKTVLENLICRVVSSFEYIIRPLSRNSQDRTIEAPADETKPKRKKPARKAKTIEEEAPRRASSRIQQLQLKKVAEQEEEMKKMIELNAKKLNNSSVPVDEDSRSRGKSSGKTNCRRSESPDDDVNKNGKKRRKGRNSWRRSKGKKKLSWDKDDSDLSSVSSITESNDEEDDFEVFNDSTFKYDNDDDEFACEDEETNNEPVIVKRARTARQSLGLDQQGSLDSSSILEEDKPCGRCDKSDDPEWILLCDMCDDGYHTSCCLPPLMIVPDGDWYCPPCEHKMLLTKLRAFHASITEILEAKERERQKRQRLRQNNVKKATVELPAVELPERRQRDILNELNEPIAIQDLDEVLGEETPDDDSPKHGRERVRPKKRSQHTKSSRRRPKYEDDDEDDDGFIVDHKKPRRTHSRHEMTDSDDEDELEDYQSESSESNEPKPKTRRARASVSYRFQEYDELIKSAIQGDYYDEERNDDDDDDGDGDGDGDDESEPEKCTYGRGKDMATIEALAYQQENNLFGQGEAMPFSSELNSPPPKSKPKKKGRRLNDLDAVSEAEDATSDESFQASSATEAEEEDEDLTEADSYGDSETSIDELVSATYSRSKKKKKPNRRRSSNYSDDSDYEPRTRRAASKRISYKESTDEDEVAEVEMSMKKSKKNTLDSDESQASWRGSPQSVADDVDDGSTSCGELSPDLQQNNNEQVEELAKTETPVLKTLSDEHASIPTHQSFYDGDPTIPMPSNYNLN